MATTNPRQNATIPAMGLVQDIGTHGVGPFASKLAPVYGDLTEEASKDVDHELKVMVEATTQLMEDQSKRTWSTLCEQMTQNPMIEAAGDEQCSTQALIEDDGNSFQLRDIQEALTKREIYTKFVNLVGDNDVVDSTWINIESLASSVSATGETIAMPSNKSHQERLSATAALGVGILRYPDISEPCYKTFCIKIDVHSTTGRGAAQTTTNSITCEYRCRKFRPRPTILEEIVSKAAPKAVKGVEEMFA